MKVYSTHARVKRLDNGPSGPPAHDRLLKTTGHAVPLCIWNAGSAVIFSTQAYSPGSLPVHSHRILGKIPLLFQMRSIGLRLVFPLHNSRNEITEAENPPNQAT